MKKLHLVFLDEDANEYTLILSNPKTNLTLSAVTTVMEGIISDGVLLTNKGKALDAVNKCFYRETTDTVLTDPGGAE